MVVQGAAAAVVAPDVARRKLLGQGTPPASARVVTHLRVMCVGTGATATFDNSPSSMLQCWFA